MANSQPFSLFPQSVPTVAVPNPKRRQPSLHKIHTLHTMGGHGLKASSGDGSRMDVGSEHPLPTVPTSYSVSHSRTPSDEIGMAVTTISPIDGSTPSPSFPKDLKQGIGGNTTSPDPGSIGSSTLVQGQQVQSSPKSPIVPIRSMFPVYNPAAPLNRQPYHPQRPVPAHLSNIPRNTISRNSYRNTISSPIDSVVGVRTAPASVLNFPSDLFSLNEHQFSSYRDLEILWAATHGTEPTGSTKTFDLEMSRSSEAVFTFGCDPRFPFYTLKTFDTNEIAVIKTNPRKRTAHREVVLSNLESAERKLPPNDGLVSFIFPKPAALLAINQSAELAQKHDLASTDRDDIEAVAIRRAADQEACNLRWNEMYKRYELEHPAIGRRRRSPEFIMTPQSPPHDEKPVLHITVSSNGLSSPSPPVILVTNPQAMVSPDHSTETGFRLSTVPRSDESPILASLNFGTLTLHINAGAILELMPSLFAVDCIVSAMFAIAVADTTTNPVMASMRVNSPRPKGPPSVFGGQSVKSYAQSTFYATIAEREEAEEEARLMRIEHEKDIRGDKKDGNGRNWFGKSKKAKQDKHKKQIVIGEFDLEKLGHYQSGDRKGEELPGITRNLLSALVMGLKLLVWMLTTLAQFLAWVLVTVSRGVTSENF